MCPINEDDKDAAVWLYDAGVCVAKEAGVYPIEVIDVVSNAPGQPNFVAKVFYFTGGVIAGMGRLASGARIVICGVSKETDADE